MADGRTTDPSVSALVRRPTADEVPGLTDHYFNKTKAAVARFGDKRVTYAVFMRRPVVCAPRLAIEWLETIAAARGGSRSSPRARSKPKVGS